MTLDQRSRWSPATVKINLQFHATRDEIEGFIASWASEFRLWCAYEHFTPSYQADLVTQGGLHHDIRIPPTVSRIVLSTDPISMNDPAPPYGLIRHNPDSLTILVGAQTATMLGESSLQALTDDPTSLHCWKEIRRMLTSALHRGAVVRNTMTGAVDRIRDHHYSGNALRLCSASIRMAGLTDWLIYEFPERC